MAMPCSCHVIDTAIIQDYLRANGPVLTEKRAKAVRSTLHKQQKEERMAEGLAEKRLCGICADNLFHSILTESGKMYPQQHAAHNQAEKLTEAA